MPVASHRPRIVRLLAALFTGLLALTGCGPSVEPAGEVTEVTVVAEGMHYVPDLIEVPIGNQLIITFENNGVDPHDIVLDNGKRTANIMPGESAVLDAGVIGEDLDGWCSVSNHRAMGMELTIVAIE